MMVHAGGGVGWQRWRSMVVVMVPSGSGVCLVVVMVGGDGGGIWS